MGVCITNKHEAAEVGCTLHVSAAPSVRFVDQLGLTSKCELTAGAQSLASGLLLLFHHLTRPDDFFLM